MDPVDRIWPLYEELGGPPQQVGLAQQEEGGGACLALTLPLPPPHHCCLCTCNMEVSLG